MQTYRSEYQSQPHNKIRATKVDEREYRKGRSQTQDKRTTTDKQQAKRKSKTPLLPAPTSQGNTPHSALPLSQILRFASHHSQLVGLHSPVAMENRSYPDFIWWARTQEVYPDGVVGVLNSALAVPNICACRNSVVIGDRILSLKGTTWWRIRDPSLLLV